MGMGNGYNGNQYTFDPITRTYNPVNYGFGMSYNNMFTRPMQQPIQKSPIADLLAQALAAKPNAPTMAQLFPGMVAPNMGGSQGMPIGLLGQGQYGAGRFLGSNVMGNPSLTSTAMNT